MPLLEPRPSAPSKASSKSLASCTPGSLKWGAHRIHISSTVMGLEREQSRSSEIAWHLEDEVHEPLAEGHRRT